jgi:hypothetical protein
MLSSVLSSAERIATLRSTSGTPFISHLATLEQSIEAAVRHSAGDWESVDKAAVSLAAVSSRDSAFVFFVFRLASYKVQERT